MKLDPFKPLVAGNAAYMPRLLNRSFCARSGRRAGGTGQEGQLVAILDQWAEDVSAEYAYYARTDRLFAQGVPSLSTLSYYEQDGKGNVVGVHTNGVANQTLSYDPWGNLESLTSTGSDTTQLRWKGLLWEEGPKLYYMRARWYDPVTRRFISQDPLGLAAGINQYAFAGGDPINASDPSGMDFCSEDDAGYCTTAGGVTGPYPSATFTCVVGQTGRHRRGRRVDGLWERWRTVAQRSSTAMRNDGCSIRAIQRCMSASEIEPRIASSGR
jgi:RHS repeat-associated protein